MMKKNIGKADKLVRVIIAVILAGLLYFTEYFSGTIETVFLVVAIVLLLTSLLNFCPMYRIFGFNTCKIKE